MPTSTPKRSPSLDRGIVVTLSAASLRVSRSRLSGEGSISERNRGASTTESGERDPARADLAPGEQAWR